MNTWWTLVPGGVVTSLMLGACAAPATIPATTQPALSAMAKPYADDMGKAGINTVQVLPNTPRVRVATRVGEVYFRDAADLSPTAFVVYVDAQGIEVDSDSYNAGDGGQYEAAIKAVLPASINRARENNRWVTEQNNSGGGGGR